MHCIAVTTIDGAKVAIVRFGHNAPHMPASPYSMGEVTEGPEAASGEGFSNITQTSGLQFHTTCRIGYWHAGDEKLYAFVRTWCFDRWGHLVSISAETRIVIDTPELCS